MPSRTTDRRSSTVLRWFACLVIQRHRAVIAMWIVALAVCGAGALNLSGELANRTEPVPGSESERAAHILANEIPGHRGSRLVFFLTFRHPRGDTNKQSLHLVRRVLARRRDVLTITQEGAAVSPGDPPPLNIVAVSAYLDISDAAAQKLLPSIREQMVRVQDHSVRIRLLGDPPTSERYSVVARHDLERAELLAFPLTMLLLLIAFRSVVAAFLPLLLAGATLIVTFAALALIGQHVALSVFVTNTASILALGLSIDFSLFVVTRFREELRRSSTVDEALLTTMTTTGRAILLSSVTIAASLQGLTVMGLQLFSSMAIGATAAALLSGLSAVTLLPAVLRLGATASRLDPARVTLQRRRPSGHGWDRLATTVTTRPVPWLLASVLLLVLLALPARSLTLDAHTITALPASDPVRVTNAAFMHRFWPGVSQPVEVVTLDTAEHADKTIVADADVRQVYPTTTGYHGWEYLRVILDSGPDRIASQHAVERLRRALKRQPYQSYVGGTAARTLDLLDRVSDRAVAVVLMTIALGFALLAWGLRSVVIPLKAVLSTLLSTVAALGALLHLPGTDVSAHHVEFFVPLFLFAILFGLSIDYEIFLLSRIREAAAEGATTRAAVHQGLVRSARSITLAGLAMTTVFLALGTSTLEPLRQLGVGLAIAVVLDITVVRCVLVPASVVLLGRWNWWFPGARGTLSPTRSTSSRQQTAGTEL